MRAILLWTINDFPAYGNLAGCSVKGKKGCPLCGVNTHHRWLNHSRKNVYMGHRIFLPPSDSLRKQKTWFDNTIENGHRPIILTGRNVSIILKNFPNNFGKKIKTENNKSKKGKGKKKLIKKLWRKKRKNSNNREDDDEDGDPAKIEPSRWKKRSIFFDLPYWEVSVSIFLISQ